MSDQMRIAVLVSGGGTNLQALIDAQAERKIKNGFLCAVVSSKEDAFALSRARKAGIPEFILARKDYPISRQYDEALIRLLDKIGVDLVVLAGFMNVLGPDFCSKYKNRIINVHPSLIPSFCGDGFYGLRVHKAALSCGVKVTGATVHFVNEVTDGGAIILQKAVEVKDSDTPESLQMRVMKEAEWELLPKAVSLFCEGRLQIEDGHVRILE
ncbi:MAG: phosphoribosylglycinamide formyltransferase [Clostridiales bacterium]|nr:phosphoribosylglycinamide formyltransferase [Clostridiales bacterium]